MISFFLNLAQHFSPKRRRSIEEGAGPEKLKICYFYFSLGEIIGPSDCLMPNHLHMLAE
jgi:hypothetical protein